MRKIFLLLFVFLLCQLKGYAMFGSTNKLSTDQVVEKLVSNHGMAHKARIERGVQQVARFWRETDGTTEEFAAFCETNFIADSAVLKEIADRFEQNLEQIFGLNTKMQRNLQRQIHLNIGTLRPVDMLFAEFNPFAHLEEDFFRTKIAFAALLNFPLYTLQELLTRGGTMTRQQWAEARLVQQFSQRVPAEVKQAASQAYLNADHYISNYNIYMHNLVTSTGERLFPEGLKLITHWGLRDELKAQYANTDGYTRQKMIQQVMERIIRQEIPAIVVDNPAVDWNPVKNTVKFKKQNSDPGSVVSDMSENNARYTHLLNIFHAEQLADPYYPNMPTKMDRRFQDDREIPEQEFEQLLISILSAPVAKDVARLIEKRLGRKPEPFDIWYDGFKARSTLDITKLDALVAQKYPTAAAFQADLPTILTGFGFTEKMAAFLGSKITVEPSRGAGHAYGAGMRSDNAHLRTRVSKNGMNYKGYNIAIHELGHNVEQVLSLNCIDHTILQGVPNTAFTEGFAFVFQSRDLELLGFKQNDPEIERLKIIDNYWSTFEISGVALVDMYVWRWMYQHPEATAAELNAAVQKIAKEVWNQYFAPVLGIKDQILLAVYSHMIDGGLYLPDYPLGHIISFQVEQYFKDKNLADEMERMCKLGAITPSAWMEQAVSAPISTTPLIEETEKSVTAIMY